jgi:8-oxo-dGTP pyrophosphatase MutT (NUDIX family)
VTLGAPTARGPELVDRLEHRPVEHSERVFEGMVWDVVRDTVDLGEAGTVRREYVRHPGAVSIVALDDRGRVLLIQQYRHPVGYRLWEPPAGLRDVDGEPTWRTAARELGEEAGYRATEWHTLLDIFTSPGMTNERVRIFLARGLGEIPEGESDFERIHEEAGMPVVWVPLDDAVAAIRRGHLHNPLAVMGILAVYAARATGYRDLRAPDAPEG